MTFMKRIQQVPQVRKFLPWIIAAAILLIGYPWFIQPIQQAALAYSQRNHIENNYQQHLNHLQRITARQKQQRERLWIRKQQHDSLFFSPHEADAFFSSFDQTAASFDCHVVSAEYQIQEAPGTDTKEYCLPVFLHRAKIELTGSYNCWIQFLEWIESLPQCILIDSLKLESGKDRPEVLKGRIDLAIPVQKEIVQPGSADPSSSTKD